jgi:hypothetical protein
MKTLFALALAAALAGCGVETASTAATAASMKKQEIEQGQKTMTRAEQKIGAAVQQMNDSADNAAKAADEQGK